ncbi:prepilin-type N-terminal cleavage/methylation domain-containing protein [Clostridium tertium]|uniref:prepilin-type N-terminal cleavage/methylation domain-containing protein n=1 Tax=Clostridium tertium TaxID=1559 RepID=UPI0023B30703|nr:prepilin-type N-terminal cleavage/methylation domain-containing protein [Clostridium tertium]
MESQVITKKKQGFTLMELIIVIAIIAILAAVMAPKIVQHVNESRSTGVLQNGNAVIGAVENTIAKSINVNLTSDKLTTELNKLSITNPVTKGGVAYAIVASGAVPTNASLVKGCVYIEVSKGDLTNIQGAKIHRIDAYGEVMQGVVLAGQQ